MVKAEEVTAVEAMVGMAVVQEEPQARGVGLVQRPK